MLMIFISVALATVFLAASSILQLNGTSDPTNVSAFECGFENVSNIRSPFSMKFFILCILFLIFDIEISLFIPCLSLIATTITPTFIALYIAASLIILILGLLYEYSQGMLSWTDFFCIPRVSTSFYYKTL